MSRYTIICTNVECTYELGFTMNYVPKTEGKKCDLCGSDLTSSDVANTPKAMASAALVSGVGDINKRLPGDFRDFMQKIKNNTPGNNMKDYK